jgi:membrane protein implicated in regulation of membrane protease activity
MTPPPVPVSNRRKRTMMTFAVGLLLLDGALLLMAAVWTRNWMLGALGTMFVILAGAVIMYWRRYRQALEEVDQAREALKAEALELRRLIEERKAK